MIQLMPIDLNGLRELKADWDRWFACDAALFEISRPYFEHAYDLCVKGRADAHEGIYQLVDDAGIISSEAFSAEALAKIVYDEAAAELCVVWNACHPKYRNASAAARHQRLSDGVLYRGSHRYGQHRSACPIAAHLHAKCG